MDRTDKIDIWEEEQCGRVFCYHPMNACKKCNYNLKNNSFRRFKDRKFSSSEIQFLEVHDHIMSSEEISKSFVKRQRNQHIDALDAITQLLSEDSELWDDALYQTAMMHLHSACNLMQKYREE